MLACLLVRINDQLWKISVVRVTAERGGPPVEQHSSGSAGRWVGSQSRAEALLTIHTCTHIIATEPLERTRVHHEVARTEDIRHNDRTRLLCKSHWKTRED